MSNKIKWQAKCNMCQYIVSESENFKSLEQLADKLECCPNCGVELNQEDSN